MDKNINEIIDSARNVGIEVDGAGNNSQENLVGL